MAEKRTYPPLTFTCGWQLHAQFVSMAQELRPFGDPRRVASG